MTEEILRDAFDAAARTVQPEALRPLTAPDEPWTPRRWPVPVIAAAAVTVIVAGSVVVFGQSPAAPPGESLAGIPKFFVTSDLGDGKGEPSTLRVHDSVTGKVRDTVSAPARGLSFGNVAATGDGRTFIVTAKPADQWLGSAGANRDDCRVRTYRLRITDSGRISRLSTVAGDDLIAIKQTPMDSVAASRDGKKIAYSGQSCNKGDHRFKIVVRDTATGALREWVDEGTTNIADLSWTGNGRHLAYSRYEMAPADGNRFRGDEVLLLDTTAAGGAPVVASRVLLRLSAKLPGLSSIAVDADGSQIFALAWTRMPPPKPASPGKVDVVRPLRLPDRRSVSVVEVAGGRVVRTLYRWDGQAFAPFTAQPIMKTDVSGRHLLVLKGDLGGARRLVRIDNGVAHPLPGAERTIDFAW